MHTHILRVVFKVLFGSDAYRTIFMCECLSSGFAYTLSHVLKYARQSSPICMCPLNWFRNSLPGYSPRWHIAPTHPAPQRPYIRLPCTRVRIQNSYNTNCSSTASVASVTTIANPFAMIKISSCERTHARAHTRHRVECRPARATRQKGKTIFVHDAFPHLLPTVHLFM